MTAIQFYHLTTTPLERALPKLLEKAYGSGVRVMVLAESSERAEQLNQLLWTYDPGSFLPHGSKKDGNPEAQPIWISDVMEAPLGAEVLVVTDGREISDLAPFSRVLDIFDGNNEEATENARRRWQAYQKRAYPLRYFKQSAQGAWEQKESASSATVNP